MVTKQLPGLQAPDGALYITVTDGSGNLVSVGPSNLFTQNVGIFKSNPVNANLYIGSGTGSLTDNPVMGLAVKVNTSASKSQDASHFNLNIISGSANGQVSSIISRLDVNDANSTGNGLSIWGQTMIHSASSRNTWAGNLEIDIDSASGYTGTAVGLEIGYFNHASGASLAGTALHLVSGNTAGDTNAQAMLNIQGNFVNGVMVSKNGLLSGGGSSGVGPTNYAYYFGSETTGNVPSGTPLFGVDTNGNVCIQNSVISNVSLSLGGILNLKTYIVSSLPSASSVTAGSISFVTDSNSNASVGLGNTVVGGGSNKVLVYSDGTNWICV